MTVVKKQKNTSKGARKVGEKPAPAVKKTLRPLMKLPADAEKLAQKFRGSW